MGSTQEYPGVQSKVMAYFEEHAGRPVYVEKLERVLGCPREVAQRAVANIRRRPDWHGKVVQLVRGQAWRYEPGTVKASAAVAAKVIEPTGRIFEELMAGEDGGILLVCEDGELYLAHHVKLPVRGG